MKTVGFGIKLYPFFSLHYLTSYYYLLLLTLSLTETNRQTDRQTDKKTKTINSSHKSYSRIRRKNTRAEVFRASQDAIENVK